MNIKKSVGVGPCLAYVAAVLIAAFPAVSDAQTTDTYAPIYVKESDPSKFYVMGSIDGRTAFNFKRAIKKYGIPKVMILSSPGGLVHEALLMAMEIESQNVHTVVLDKCYSACFFLFAAGQERSVRGELGVHQMSSDGATLSEGQTAVADIVDVLARLNISNDVLAIMLRTPPDQIHVFTNAELVAFGLVTDGTGADRVAVSPTTLPLVEQAIDYVSWHNRLWSEDNQTAMERLPGTYADEVAFYDNRRTRNEVIAEKRAFADRWPVRDYRFRPSRDASSCSGDHCTIVGEVDWYAHSPERSKTSRGTAAVVIELLKRGSEFLIVGEGGRVISRN